MHRTLPELLSKFRNDSITADELRLLRRLVDESPASEIEDAIGADWLLYDSNILCDNPEMALVLKSMKEKIDEALRRRRMRWLRRAAAVAAVLVPVLVASTAYFYSMYRAVGDTPVAISASTSSACSLTLPDGSRVALGPDADVRYEAADFTRDTRRIRFCGEGYFEIASDPEKPFLIDAGRFEVLVHGTRFNLFAGADGVAGELALEEGVVELRLNGHTTRMQSGERAVIDASQGTVAIESPTDISEATAWRRGEIVLRDADAAQISAAINRYYGVEMSITGDFDSTATFTGTLPMGSIQDAMTVVQLALGADVAVRP
ncbi:MAG: FecR domain-containing protein [Muribaculaceae bacterium]|nr:FecR domain-containing protein [Muribaculaceae bacterium]